MDVNRIIKNIPAFVAQVLGGISAVLSVGEIFGFDFAKLPATYILPILFAVAFGWIIEKKNVILSAVLGAVMVIVAAVSVFADMDYELTFPIYTAFCAVGWSVLWKGRMGGTLVIPLLLFIIAAIPCFFGADNSAGIILAIIASVLTFLVDKEKRNIKAGVDWKRIANPILLTFALLVISVGMTQIIGYNEPSDKFNRAIKGWSSYKDLGQYSSSFSMEEIGYNYADGTLGGPASLGSSDVFEVKTNLPINLRCNVQNVYDGDSWRKTNPHYNYPYLQFIKGGDYKKYFCTELPLEETPEGVFTEVEIEITPVRKNMKSLAIPVTVGSIDFGDNEGSLIYNNLGEIFSTEFVKEKYSIKARVPNTASEEFDEWMTENADSFDEDPEVMREIRRLYCKDDGTKMVTEVAEYVMGQGNSYVKAKRLRDWLATTKEYSLTPNSEYAYSEDFVENFLCSNSGYCVHFATAMTVMLRTQGIPARYVTGFSVDPKDGTTTIVTEKNAHAWCEVYFEGIGWIPFDATAFSDTGPATMTPPEARPTEPSKPEPTPLQQEQIPEEEGETSVEAEGEETSGDCGASLVALLLVLLYSYIVYKRIVDFFACSVSSWRKIERAMLACGIRRRKNESLIAFAKRAENLRFSDCGLVRAAEQTEMALYAENQGEGDEKCLEKVLEKMSVFEKFVFAVLKPFV